jgi:hypothetical protein
VLAFIPLCAGATASTFADARAELSVSRGYDSNPLELPSDGGTGEIETGAFTQIDLGASVDRQLGRTSSFFLGAGGSTRLYQSRVSEGNHGWADARAGLSLTPYRHGDRRFSVAIGGTYGLYRSSFVDPATGEIFEVGSDPAAAVSVPDRFDFDSVGGFLDLRWRLRRRVLLFLDSAIERRSYLESYADDTSLQPLDDRSLTLEPGVRVMVGESFLLDLSLQWADREYEALDALDESANRVPGTRRSYRYAGYRIALHVDPGPGWELSLGLRATDRGDAHAGFYDYSSGYIFLSAGYRLGDRTRFRAHLSQRNLRYDNALVDEADPDSPYRGSEILRFVGRGERRFGDHLSLFIEAGVARTESKDPLYVYDREWAQAGFSVYL